MTALRDVDITNGPAALRAVVLHAAWAHPIWHSYYLALVHLRPVEGLPPVHLEHPNATHEISLFAMDPATPIPEGDPIPTPPGRLLHPPNLIVQLNGHTDATALAVFGDFAEAIAQRRLSPDTDQRKSQLAWLERRSAAS